MNIQMLNSPNAQYAAIEQAVADFMTKQPIKLHAIITRGMVDIITQIDSDGNEYGMYLPYHNLYLDGAKTSNHPKTFRIYWNHDTEMYETYNDLPFENDDGTIKWERITETQMNIGQLLSADVTSIGIDPCGENKVAIFIKQVPCEFDNPIVRHEQETS